MCHSLDYIPMNSVFLDRKGWEASVTKMMKVMGAPIGERGCRRHRRLPGPQLRKIATADEDHVPGVRAADRRAGSQDRRAALRAGGLGAGHLRGDQPAAEEEQHAHQGDLRQALALADLAGGASSAAAVHARLHPEHLHRFPGAARRPLLRRRSLRSSAGWPASAARP